ncbi:GNAT family N-acetyltransferase [Arthrobacter sp. APC 3897]|uniref:GNAT family N-acetyltransferase n=1 Tax=Arthrobacter sp. APC 3897 TaxID=3035204 RepID=UPI0025B58AC7|nr:GNAT family N-acetyltransferase [Arthrobacter sp. APC 3897]MDN3482940.1 GNAT family N-acetyltransferase [Arthrobacter sp. APC 3897]
MDRPRPLIRCPGGWCYPSEEHQPPNSVPARALPAFHGAALRSRAVIEQQIKTPSGRLILRRPVPGDLDGLFRMYSDPRLIECDPTLAHSSIAHTQAVLERRISEWQQHGHGLWVLESSECGSAGELVGIGGCRLLADTAWNLSFSLRPRSWGCGYAREVAAAGIEYAGASRPGLPVTAVVAKHNTRSRRAVERAGLRKEWEGPDNHDPDPASVMLLYADRTLSDAQVLALTR